MEITVQQFMDKHNLSTRIWPTTPRLHTSGPGSRYFMTESTRPGAEKAFRIQYSQGSGVKDDPTPVDIWVSLVQDIRLWDCNDERSLAEGYNITGQDYRTFKAQMERLRAFLPADAWDEAVRSVLAD